MLASSTQVLLRARYDREKPKFAQDHSAANANADMSADISEGRWQSTRADPERVARYRRGHLAEWMAAILLMLHGYRILSRRHRTPFGEVDIIARRGRRLAFVEVKRRPTLEAARQSFSPSQGERIGRAAEHFMRGRHRYRDHEMGMDLILVGGWVWPRHLTDAFHQPWDSWKRR